jgi:small subunit ribosomal protein S3Ae
MAKGKVIDTWKTKSWYSVLAPEIFESREIAQIPASEESCLINRIMRVSLADLTGDMSQVYTTLHFRIKEIKGKTAFTKLIGHELLTGYLKALVKRRRDVINEVVDVQTKDNVPLKIKMTIFTAKKISSKIKTAIRNNSKEEVKERAKEMDFSHLEQEIIFGKFSTRIFNRVKKIAPIKRVEIRKTEVVEKFTS